LARGQVVIVFDALSESVSILTREELTRRQADQQTPSDHFE
jgi:hypothetical protein